ncbi:MAG: PEGA domain-containing protein [Trueperaceae bacterium]
MLKFSACLCMVFFPFLCWAQTISPSMAIVIPTFGVRGQVDKEVVETFMQTLREVVTEQTGLEVKMGELVSQGLTGSLEPELAFFSAELEGTRFAVSGEIRAVDETYAVAMLVADRISERSSDVLDAAFTATNAGDIAQSLAAEVTDFVAPIEGLQGGSASLFISGQPSGAEVFINDNKVGETGNLDVLSLQPGSYQIEVRAEGFSTETKYVALNEGMTELVHMSLTPVSGGSLQIITLPSSEVVMDDVVLGWSPITVQALSGTRRVQLQRPGFETVVRDVQVRDSRVTRMEEALKPQATHMIFWDDLEAGRLEIDNVLQTQLYAELPSGKHLVELSRNGKQRSFDIVIPETGIHKLNLETGELEVFHP